MAIITKTIVKQPNDKILVGGSWDSYNGFASKSIIRLNTDYSLDTTFITGGGIEGNVNVIKIQDDGKILVGGGFTSYSGVTQYNIIRLNTGGTIDDTFVSYFDDNKSNVYAIAIQDDGKILLGGSLTDFSGTSTNRIIRLNTDGTKDTSFVVDAGFNGDVYDIVIQPDGKILVGGVFTEFKETFTGKITRLTTTGDIDSTFGVASGIIGTNFDGTVYKITLLSNGKILVGGKFVEFNGWNCSNRLVRLNSNGTLDSTFIPWIPSPAPPQGFNGDVLDIVVESDGKILVGGAFTQFNDTITYNIVRLNIDGTLDINFMDTDSYPEVTPINSGSQVVFSICKLNTNKILIGGVDFDGGFSTTFREIVEEDYFNLNMSSNDLSNQTVKIQVYT